jgi:nitroreductase
MSMEAMDELGVVEQLLNRRSSCRAFRPDPVPPDLLRRIAAIAQRTASWCNSQPWQVIITSGKATEALREAIYARAVAGEKDATDIPFPREYLGVYQDRRRETGLQLYEAIGLARSDKDGRLRQTLENFRMFGAPHVAIITSDEALGPYGAVDCGAYVANFLLALEAAGLGAIAQAALAHHSAFIRNHFGLGDDRRVVCGISFGFPDLDHPANTVRTARASIDDAVRLVL